MSDYVRRLMMLDEIKKTGANLSVEDLFALLADRGITFMYQCDGKKCSGCSAVLAKKGSCTRTCDITHAKNLKDGVAIGVTFAEVTSMADVYVPDVDPKTGKVVGFKREKERKR